MVYPYSNYYIDGIILNKNDVNRDKVKKYWAESGLIIQ
jgi:hypothetical protein